MEEITRESILVAAAKVDMAIDTLEVGPRECNAIFYDSDLIVRLEKVIKDLRQIHELLINQI